MIELIALFILGRKIGDAAADRGYGTKLGRYRILLVLSWFGGEIAGVLIGLIFSRSVFIFYPLGLAGAVIGARIAFQTVKRLPVQEPSRAKTNGSAVSYGNEVPWSQWTCPRCGAANTRYDRIKCFQCGALRPGVENPGNESMR